MSKKPFDIDFVLAQVREAIQPFAKAAFFQLAEEGYNSPFEILITCILSVRTRDEVTVPCARSLF